MFITLMHEHGNTDAKQGAKRVSDRLDIEQAIRRMDGKRRDVVMLMEDDEEGAAHMAISGGPDRFASFVTYDEEAYHILSAPGEEGKFGLKFLGQYVDLPRDKTTDLQSVLVAARNFAERGELSSLVIWYHPKDGCTFS